MDRFLLNVLNSSSSSSSAINQYEETLIYILKGLKSSWIPFLFLLHKPNNNFDASQKFFLLFSLLFWLSKFCAVHCVLFHSSIIFIQERRLNKTIPNRIIAHESKIVSIYSYNLIFSILICFSIQMKIWALDFASKRKGKINNDF